MTMNMTSSFLQFPLVEAVAESPHAPHIEKNTQYSNAKII